MASRSLVLCLGDEIGVEIREDDGAELVCEPPVRNLPILNFRKVDSEWVDTEVWDELCAALLVDSVVGVGDDAGGRWKTSFGLLDVDESDSVGFFMLDRVGGGGSGWRSRRECEGAEWFRWVYGERVEPAGLLRCGVRDVWSPIAICSTVGVAWALWAFEEKWTGAWWWCMLSSGVEYTAEREVLAEGRRFEEERKVRFTEEMKVDGDRVGESD